MKIKKYTVWIFGLVILSRFIGVISCGQLSASMERLTEGRLKEQFQNIFTVNNDEVLIAEVALNYHNGLGFVSHENVRTGYRYDFTAYRPTYPVYVHILAMEVYLKIVPSATIKLDRTDPYFILYAFFIHLISFGLFILSLIFFRRIALCFLDPAWANISLLLYGFHPAVVYYVGNYANYESITTSLLIVSMALVLKAVSQKISISEFVLFICCFISAVLFRPQLQFIYMVLFMVYFFIAFFKRRYFKHLFLQSVKLLSVSFLVFMIFNTPVLVKNYRLFNGLTLATTGFNFHLGHNPFARGSWDGRAGFPDSPYYKYVREKIPGYNEMNEYEKSWRNQVLAWEWIKNNPGAEVMLTIRKVAIYFIPVNNDSDFFNPFNLVYHLGTILFCIYITINRLIRKKSLANYFILASPLAGSLLVTIVFHVGYRWRYYAEPFMVIMTIIVISDFVNTKIKKVPQLQRQS